MFQGHFRRSWIGTAGRYIGPAAPLIRWPYPHVFALILTAMLLVIFCDTVSARYVKIPGALS